MGDLSSPLTPLHRAWPGTRAFPRVGLGQFPTRVHRLEGLLPEDVELWVKREDESGAGNKLRKLEFLFGAARAAGKRRLATFGGQGSHHVAATALYGPPAGFEVEAAIFPQPLDDHVRELERANQRSGARLVQVGGLLGVLPEMARARLRRDCQWLAGGGSSVIGTLGWVSGALEMLQQVESGQLPPFDAVYGALGSGGTIAGLVYGLPAPIEVVAVRVVQPWMCGERTVRRLVDAVGRTLQPFVPAQTTARLRVVGDFAGRYGVPTPESLAATQLAEKLHLEPIYTGKVMAALLADAAAGRLRGRRVLFLHSAYNLVPRWSVHASGA